MQILLVSYLIRRTNSKLSSNPHPTQHPNQPQAVFKLTYTRSNKSVDVVLVARPFDRQCVALSLPPNIIPRLYDIIS